MDDDFNTADAIAAVFELVKYINTTADGTRSKEYLDSLYKRLESLTDVLGIIIEKKEEMLDEEIEAMIEKRQAARKERNFALADQIRDELLARGIILEDTREGVKWKKRRIRTGTLYKINSRHECGGPEDEFTARACVYRGLCV